MSVYPKWIYSKDHEAKIVHSKEEHEAHKGWEETPTAFDQKQDETPLQSETDQASEKPSETSEVKTKDLVSMTVAQLKSALLEKGVEAEELKGLKKDELIVKLGAM